MTASRKSRTEFLGRYGPRALVLGASEGLGEAFAQELAARGLELVLVARRQERLSQLAQELSSSCGVKVDFLAADLSKPQQLERLWQELAPREFGLAVYNAAHSPIGDFIGIDEAEHEKTLRLNCASLFKMSHRLLRQLAERRRGGLVLLSSLSSFQGTARVVHYAATKAYIRVLAEGLWEEMKPMGVDILASCPGLVDTPAYRRTGARPAPWFVPPALSPAQVARETLDYLGRGPVVIPGAMNFLAGQFTGRLLPRQLAIWLSSWGTRRLYP